MYVLCYSRRRPRRRRQNRSPLLFHSIWIKAWKVPSRAMLLLRHLFYEIG